MPVKWLTVGRAELALTARKPDPIKPFPRELPCHYGLISCHYQHTECFFLCLFIRIHVGHGSSNAPIIYPLSSPSFSSLFTNVRKHLTSMGNIFLITLCAFDVLLINTILRYYVNLTISEEIETSKSKQQSSAPTNRRHKDSAQREFSWPLYFYFL